MDRKFLFALALVSCSPPASELPRADPPAEPPSNVPAAALASLQRAVVTDDTFARRTLYSWTTEATVARMRTERRALLPTNDEGHVIERLDALARAAGPAADVARLLTTHPSFAARRYAWIRPFATRVPLSDRSYGDHLVELRLKPSAVIARFDGEAFRFVDLEGQEVPLGAMLADPSRLAALFHVGKHPQTGDGYREYVLCNEAMIEEWSVGTEAIRAAVADDAAMVRELRGAPRDVLDRYLTALAFHTKRHQPTPENLGDLATLLDDVARDEPLVVTPAVAFVSLGAHPPPVPALPPGFGVVPRKYICDYPLPNRDLF